MQAEPIDPVHYLLPKEQIDDVMSQWNADAEIQPPNFYGFTDYYQMLAACIGSGYTVIDFGCGYNAQSFFFRNHCHFIAVDTGEHKRFQAPNTELYQNTSISQFIDNYVDQDSRELKMPNYKVPLDACFAIVNYVPSWQTKSVREVFPNCFSFYPSIHVDSNESQPVGRL